MRVLPMGVRCLRHARFLAILLSTSWMGMRTSGADEVYETTPVYSGLGGHSRPVATNSSEAQQYFNQGLNFLFAFNHDEAIRSFERATQLDPHCAMAWWGIAIAKGPHINNPVLPPERAQEAFDAWQRAQAASESSGAVEKALIDALGKRYDPNPMADRKPLDEAYAAAMRKVWQRFSTDADIGALFAESLMDLRPWDLWQSNGTPQPGTSEIVQTLEQVLELLPHHPLGLHLYIHAVEASPHPELADEESDRLRTLQPGLGHMVHMPSHIDVRRGRWSEAVTANQRAIEADRAYRATSPKQDFYRVYMAHNHHMLAYAAMMRGQSQITMKAISEMADAMPETWVRENAAIADGFMAMPIEVLVRFGRWSDILNAAEPPLHLPFTRTMHHYARAISLAALKRTTEANRERDAFAEARRHVASDARCGNNLAHDLLDVAEHLMNGEILYREGQVDAGLAAMRKAVALEDALRYDEPPDWIHPVRHALGATLIQEKRAAEAEQIYREDLARLPKNGWSLFGLARSLEMQAKTPEAEAVREEFEQVWKDADVELQASCFCQPGNGGEAQQVKR